MNHHRFVSAAVLTLALSAAAHAQWTITFVVDEQQATTALGEERVRHMRDALARAKTNLEGMLSGSTGSVNVTIDWSAPPNPDSVAVAVASQVHIATVAVARDKLINKATADNEPASEILLYESLPPTSVPYFHDTESPLLATHVKIPNSLNKHLAFQPTTNQNDGTLRFRPPSATLKWQFWRKPGAALPGNAVFQAVVMHETFHLLGFISEADLPPPLSALRSWDLFRFRDSSVPVNANAFLTTARELRPTQEATGITALSSATNAYKLSRGTRLGGDGNQASHWRSYSRLTPPNPIGMMDPTSSAVLYEQLSGRYYTRADVEALDVMGWNVNPDAVSYATAAAIDLVAPLAAAQFAQGSPITFEWEATSALTLDVMIYPGTEIVDDNPVRVFYQLPAGTTSATLPYATGCGESSATLGFAALPPGEYVWAVIGDFGGGDRSSEIRRLTITATCPADVDDGSGTGTRDGAVDINDLLFFLSAFEQGNIAADLDDGTGTGTPDEAVNISDLLYFLNRFDAGC